MGTDLKGGTAAGIDDFPRMLRSLACAYPAVAVQVTSADALKLARRIEEGAQLKAQLAVVNASYAALLPDIMALEARLDRLPDQFVRRIILAYVMGNLTMLVLHLAGAF